MSTVRRHSGDESKYTIYDPAGTQWPANIKDVQSALNLIGPWARTDEGIPVASYTVQGIAAIATNADIDAGTDETKIVSPAGLKYAMTKPEATISRFGMTRYATNKEALDGLSDARTITAKALDYVFDNRRSTEANAGALKVATILMAQSGVDDTTIMTPVKVKAAIDALVPDQATATESIMGVSKLATTQEMLDGVARQGVAVSPYAFAKANATEAKFGTVKIANVVEMKSNSKTVVSAERFRTQRASLTEIGTTQLTDSFGETGKALSSTAPVIKKSGDDMTGRLKLKGDDYITRKELHEGIVPVGYMCMSACPTPPADHSGMWMGAWGQDMNKNDYSELFAAIGYTYGGSGDFFKLPDMRHQFARGASHDRPAGQREEDTMQNIIGTFMSWDHWRTHGWVSGPFRLTGARWNTNVKNGGSDDWGNQVEFNAARVVRTSHETRPVNVALWYVIRVK